MIIKRIKAATRTNEPQATSVLGFTGLTMAAFFMQPDHRFWFGFLCFFFWPALVFVFNLINPLPEPKPCQYKDDKA